MRKTRGAACNAIVAFVLVGGCGGRVADGETASDSGVGTDADFVDVVRPDTSIGTDTKNDVVGFDTHVDCGHDGCGGSSPTLLARGNYFMLDSDTTTSDGYIVALNADASTLQAIPLAGGTPIDIVPSVGGNDIVVTSGRVVMVMTNVRGSSGNVASLGVWTKSGGYHPLTTSAVVSAASFAASVDGSMVAFTEGTVGKTTNVSVSDTSGGGNKRVVTGATNNRSCTPYLVGTAKAVAVASCASPSTTASLAVYDRSGTETTFPMIIKPKLSVDENGTEILTVYSDGQAAVYAPDGSGGSFSVPNVIGAELTPEGTKAIWLGFTAPSDTMGPVFSGDVTATPAPKKIADVGAVTLFPIAKGSKYALYATTLDPATGLSDLDYAFVDGSAPPIVVSTDTQSAIFGDAYTNDEKFAVFFGNVAASGSALVGDLMVLDLTSAGATATRIATNVWLDWSPNGETILYNDNWLQGGNGSEGVADIRIANASSPGASTLVAKQAENNFFFTRDRTHIVFASSDPSMAAPGIYLAPIP